MTRRNSTQPHRNKDLYWGRLSRDFKHADYHRGGAYNSVETTHAIPLTPNKLEMEYEQTRIKHEGPNSKKWPGANWVAETTATRHFGSQDSAAGENGHDGGSQEGHDSLQRDVSARNA